MEIRFDFDKLSRAAYLWKVATKKSFYYAIQVIKYFFKWIYFNHRDVLWIMLTVVLLVLNAVTYINMKQQADKASNRAFQMEQKLDSIQMKPTSYIKY